jgi:hypothetical protein
MLRESVVVCERARQYNPQVKINSSALNSYLYLGEYDKFMQNLPVNDSPYILFYHGFGEYYLKHREQAARDFDRAFELDPSLLPASVGKLLVTELLTRTPPASNSCVRQKIRLKRWG